MMAVTSGNMIDTGTMMMANTTVFFIEYQKLML